MDDLGSDGMSGSGSASGSSGNSARNTAVTLLENGSGHPSVGNNANVGDVNGTSNLSSNRNNQAFVMPLAAVHAAMSSSTLDRHFQWPGVSQHNQFDYRPSQQHNSFSGRPLLRNNSLGHAILPSQSQHAVPFAIDTKYDSDSDFDYRQHPR